MALEVPMVPIKDENFWKKYLDEILEERHSVTRLFSSAPEHEVNISQARSESEVIDIFITEDVNKIYHKNDVIHDICLLSWHCVLSVFSYSTQSVVGIEVAGQDGIPIIVPHLLKHVNHPETTILEMLEAVKSRTLELKSTDNRDFKTVSGIESSVDNALVFKDRQIAKFQYSYPLVLLLSESGNHLSACIDFNVSDFRREDIDQLLRTVVIIFQQIFRNPDAPFSGLNYITDQQQASLLKNQQKNTIDLGHYQSLVDLFEENARDKPNTTALVFENKKLTYKELHEKSNQLANYIMSQVDVKPGVFIGLLLERTEFVVIAMLGVWKTGAATASIDPRTPNSRIAFILNDTKTQFVLTDTINESNLSNICNESLQNCKVYNIQLYEYKGESREKPQVKIKRDHVMAGLYTSGTTGQPKGALSPHGAWLNEAHDSAIRYHLTHSETVLTLFNHSFGAFLVSLALGLSNGFTFVISNHEQIQEPEKLYQYAIENGVTHIGGTPSLISELDLSRVPTLKRVNLIGEPVKKLMYDKIRSKCKSIRIHNSYGTTEMIMCLNTDLTNGYSQCFRRVHVNETCFVVSRSLQCVPFGAVGELCYAGPGLAHGYLNLDELTQKVFVQNPFQENNGKLFRSGDLGRMFSDGSIEFIGRRDTQVKIRGFRVELGEIETAIGLCPGVKQVVAIAKSIEDAGVTMLIAYVIGSEEAEEFAILSKIKSVLPDFMIPARVIKLDKFPLTPNGKLDRKKLLLIPIPRQTSKSVSAAKPKEELLCRIWEQHLDLPTGSVGISDSFFGLGGNSILALRVVNHLNKELGTAISPAHLFKFNTVSEFVSQISEAEEPFQEIPKADCPELQLSFQQERLWVFDQFAGGLTSFNLPIFFAVLPGFHLQKCITALRGIQRRHEILRTFIRMNPNGEAYQHVTDDVFEYSTVNSTHSSLESKFLSFTRQTFDLSRDLPMRVSGFVMDGCLKYIGILFPHIVFDFWSREVFLDELQMLYNSELDKIPIPEIQYSDYAQNQRKILTGKLLEEHISYWKNVLEGYQMLRLPCDTPRENGKFYFSGDCVLLEISEEISTGIRNLASSLDVSLYSVILAGFSLMLSSYSKQLDILVGSPLACRNHIQIEGLIGFFMSALPLRQRIDPSASLTDFIKSVWNTVVLANKYHALPPEVIMQIIGHTKDPYKNRDFCNAFFQVNESKYDKIGNELKVPLRLDSAASILERPANDLDLTAIFNVSSSAIEGILVYPNQLFHRETAIKFSESLLLFLKQFSQYAAEPNNISLNQLIGYQLQTSYTCDLNKQTNLLTEPRILERSPSIYTEVIKPKTKAEIVACQIWSEVLGIDVAQFGMTNDFFDNGGNGLLALRVLFRMKNELNLDINLNQFYNLRTIGKVFKHCGMASSG